MPSWNSPRSLRCCRQSRWHRVEATPLDRVPVADELGLSVRELGDYLTELEAYGLIPSGDLEGLPPMLLEAGRQYLAMRGKVDRDALAFLAGSIEDLHAR